jgi:glycosyltransferase involved in cell wall biosynthesis
MNFVFVGSSPRAWGSEQHFVSLAKACHQAGHRVVAVVRAGSEVALLLSEAGLDVRATPFRGGEDPRAMLATFKAVREIDADWLVTCHKKHYWFLLLLARLTGTKLAVFRHLTFINDWFTRVVFPRLVDRFFVVSDFALEALVAAGAPRNRLTRLYNPIDLQQFKPDPEERSRTRAQLDLPDDAIVVGFVGRHESSKGVRELHAALTRLMATTAKLYAVWVGNGPEWQETQCAAGTSGFASRHRFIEWTRTPERFYVAFDCFAAPSLAPETFGRVVAEAQACGIPVVASTAGGLREVFADGETGVEFSGHDFVVLAGLIERLCADSAQRAAMSRAARMFVRQFDPGIILGEFLESLEQVGQARTEKSKVAEKPMVTQELFDLPPQAISPSNVRQRFRSRFTKY